jgi:sodium/hydrogen exchanger 8
MAVLFAGLTMSHYTVFNMSPVTQIVAQRVFRTVSVLAGARRPLRAPSAAAAARAEGVEDTELCIFAYLGLAVSSFDHEVNVGLIVSAVVRVATARPGGARR